MGKNELLIEKKEYIATLTLNRPRQKNALTRDLLVRIHLNLEKLARAGTVRAVLLTGGAGKVFSAGYDIGALPVDPDPETRDLLKSRNPLELALESIRNFPCPVIAMINGHAFGAGLNLAAACDLRVACRDIKVGMPPARLGLVYPPAGLRLFVEVLGVAKTREMFLTAKTYDGAAAREMGLVHQLVPRPELTAAARALATDIAANAPLAVRGIKRMLNLIGDRLVLDEPFWAEAEELQNRALGSDDLKEGQAAFAEKRKPRFRGR